MKSDMSDTHNHGEEISDDAYITFIRNQFQLESLGDRLQKIQNTTAIMKDKWRRGDEAMRDFTVCKLAGFLKTLKYWPRDKFWDLVSGCLILCLEMLETGVLGLGQDIGSRLIRLVWYESSISP
ncbi:hypothetical protein F2Q70_00017549 [Brassica cretica]|uniref:Uncharacterized protein n=1 Tax=Brassica cretica TaxID=69181 RepID=A0A8S9I286_BRACR|nr:hypothetical protein F2Q70_00017549 [Brassica cretica]